MDIAKSNRTCVDWSGSVLVVPLIFAAFRDGDQPLKERICSSRSILFSLCIYYMFEVLCNQGK